MATISDAPYANLALLRKRQGLSIEQIASSTKINVRYLKAIEAGDWSELPEGVYRRSYMRQYLAAIASDADVPEFPSNELEDQHPGASTSGWFARLWAKLASRHGGATSNQTAS